MGDVARRRQQRGCVGRPQARRLGALARRGQLVGRARRVPGLHHPARSDGHRCDRITHPARRRRVGYLSPRRQRAYPTLGRRATPCRQWRRQSVGCAVDDLSGTRAGLVRGARRRPAHDPAGHRKTDHRRRRVRRTRGRRRRLVDRRRPRPHRRDRDQTRCDDRCTIDAGSRRRRRQRRRGGSGFRGVRSGQGRAAVGRVARCEDR